MGPSRSELNFNPSNLRSQGTKIFLKIQLRVDISNTGWCTKKMTAFFGQLSFLVFFLGKSFPSDSCDVSFELKPNVVATMNKTDFLERSEIRFVC